MQLTHQRFNSCYPIPNPVIPNPLSSASSCFSNHGSSILSPSRLPTRTICIKQLVSCVSRCPTFPNRWRHSVLCIVFLLTISPVVLHIRTAIAVTHHAIQYIQVLGNQLMIDEYQVSQYNHQFLSDLKVIVSVFLGL